MIDRPTYMQKTILKLAFAAIVIFLNSDIMAQTAESDEFVQKYKELDNLLVSKKKQWIDNSRTGKWCNNCSADIFSILDAVELMPQCELGIDMPDESEDDYLLDWTGMGADIWVKNNSGKQSYNYLSYIKLKNVSAASCWQWFLLYNLRFYEPTYLSLYCSQEYVFTDEDFQEILKSIIIVPDSIIDVGLHEKEYHELKKLNIMPVRVEVDDSKSKAVISLYSWNDNVGLTEKHFHLMINKDGIGWMDKIDSKIIFEYFSGIID